MIVQRGTNASLNSRTSGIRQTGRTESNRRLDHTASCNQAARKRSLAMKGRRGGSRLRRRNLAARDLPRSDSLRYRNAARQIEGTIGPRGKVQGVAPGRRQRELHIPGDPGPHRPHRRLPNRLVQSLRTRHRLFLNATPHDHSLREAFQRASHHSERDQPNRCGTPHCSSCLFSAALPLVTSRSHRSRSFPCRCTRPSLNKTASS